MSNHSTTQRRPKLTTDERSHNINIIIIIIIRQTDVAILETIKKDVEAPR